MFKLQTEPEPATETFTQLTKALRKLSFAVRLISVLCGPCLRFCDQVLLFAAQERDAGRKPVSFCDIYHSANRYSCGHHISSIVLPRSTMWSFTQSRLVLGRELMRFQGLNPPGEVMDTYDEVKLGNLAGNACLGPT